MQKITFKTTYKKSLLIGFCYSPEEKEQNTACRDLNYYAIKMAFNKLLNTIDSFVSLSNIDRDFYERELHFSMEEREDLEMRLIDSIQMICSLKKIDEHDFLSHIINTFQKSIEEEKIKLKENLLAANIELNDKMLSPSPEIILEKLDAL